MNNYWQSAQDIDDDFGVPKSKIFRRNLNKVASYRTDMIFRIIKTFLLLIFNNGSSFYFSLIMSNALLIHNFGTHNICPNARLRNKTL